MNVYIINSPLQLLSAIEAKLHFKTKNDILVIMYCADERSKKQIDTILTLYKWPTIILLNRESKPFRIPKLIKSIQKYGDTIDTLFASSAYNLNSQAVISNFPVDNICYIDDGMSFINFNEKYLKTSSPEIPLPNLLLRLSLLAQGISLKVDTNFIDKLTVFTMLPIKNCTRPIVYNELPWLKSNTKISKQTKIGFIGQAEIVGNKKHELSLNQHISFLTKIHQVTQSEIIYFPHRRENKDQLKALEKLSFVDLHNSKLPLELEVAIEGIGLSLLIGYTSTALYTMSHLYKTIEVYFIKPSAFMEQPKTSLLEVEDYIENGLSIKSWNA